MTKFTCFLLILLACQTPGTALVAQEPVPERVVRRVVVPTEEDPQGEVQVLHRGDQVVVRTLLKSPVLKQVVAAIDNREAKRWPPDSVGFVESQRYRDALFDATAIAWTRFRDRDRREEKKQTLGIAFARSSDTATVTLFHPRLAGDFGSLQVLEAETLAGWRSRGAYVADNMIEIVRDSFGLDEHEARQLLEQSLKE